MGDSGVKEYTCDKCKTKMSIFEVGYLGSPLSKKDRRKCNPFMSLDCLCHECYTDRLNKLGKNPNNINYERN